MSAIVILLYCLLIAVGSLFGGWLPALVRLTHMRMQLIMSLVGGLMLGVAILHLLPHSVAETNSVDQSAVATLIGMVTMFCMIRILHVHQHSHDEALAGLEHQHEAGHDCDHHDHAVVVEDRAGVHELSWFGLFLGLALHTLIDGVALAASVTAGQAHNGWALAGLGTFFAILLHKPLDALSITSLMEAAEWSGRAVRAVNVTFALMCPIGALIFFFGIQGLPGQQSVVGWSLGFAAGVFLCIALADILPEVQFHRHDRISLTVALLVGILLAAAIGLVEPRHAHQPGGADVHQHEHAHDHPAH